MSSLRAPYSDFVAVSNETHNLTFVTDLINTIPGGGISLYADAGIVTYRQPDLTPYQVNYINTKTSTNSGIIEYFSIDRPPAQYLVLEVRIVASNGVHQHTRTGLRVTGNELFIHSTQVIFTDSNYVVSLVESPANQQLDIRVQSNTGSTNVVTCYLQLWSSSGAQPVVILR